MNKKMITSLVLSLSLVATGIVSPAFASETDSVTTENVVNLPENIGKNAFETLLKQQEIDFENGTPLENTNISKLSETDEAVLLYSALTKVDKLELHDFNYDVQNVKVYQTEDNKVFAEGYIVRNFVFGDDKTITGLGDDMKIEIENTELMNSKSKSNVSKTNSLGVTSNADNLEVISNTADQYSDDTTLDEFLNNYQKAVSENVIGETADTPQLMAYTYSRYDAWQYAEKHALSPNSNYKFYQGADCTNFVSQALKAGGIPNFTDWKPYTDAWINAGAFRDFVRESGGILMSTVSDTYANAKLGDVFHYDYKNKLGFKSADGWMDHTAIVTSRADMKIYVSYHSTNRLNVPREYVTSVEGGERFLSSIKD